ncbi:IclR family transcriptional regulator [Devosia sp.]|uniref:IclR family transcriptional regulator n=1 Tax=Devosia sp. TaxID=1871048 RepID=UPI002F1D94AC
MAHEQTNGEDEALPESAGKRSYSVPAAEKALDILEYMAGQPHALTLTEIAAALRRSVHELYRVIQTLEARGYLYRRADSDRYRLSLKLFELAHQMPSVRQLSDSALPVMQALSPVAQQSCHLAVLSGHEALIVLQVDSPLPMRYSVMLGAKFDFAETSSGVVIYALSKDTVREQLDAWLAQDGRSPEELASVASRAAAIRARGYEVQPSLAVSGVTNISVPIFDHLGHVVAALTVPYMPQRAAKVSLERVRELALEAGRQVSTNLGAGAQRQDEMAGKRRG